MKQPLKLTADLILSYLGKKSGLVSRRDMADHFNIRAEARVALKELLKTMVAEGVLLKKGKSYQSARQDFFFEAQVSGLTEEGEALLTPLKWPFEANQSQMILKGDRKAPAFGEKILVKCQDLTQNPLLVTFIKSLEITREILTGIFQQVGAAGTLLSTNRKDNRAVFIPPEGTLNAHEGDFVELEVLKTDRKKRLEARVLKNYGPYAEAISPSFIAIRSHGLLETFSEKADLEALSATIPSLDNRVDLRHLPLVTIDDEDARDFDDAIYALEDEDASNPQGWIIWVAIADVSHYVTPGSALDDEALERGNSVYFPDQVLPMLPENLSNNVCSLKPQEDRACVAVKMRIDRRGHLLDYNFMRGLMRSYNRLTYQGVQQALEGQHTSYDAFTVEKILHPLYKAYGILRQARNARGALDIERSEERIYLDKKGHITKIAPRPHYDSHEIVEEMMILANVATAIYLTDHQRLGIFRVHDQPDGDKVYALSEFLKTLGLSLAKGQAIRPKVFNKLLSEAKKTPYHFAVQELILRTQAQAQYSPHNLGHYGLGLPRYMHFTSPIRRYADLIVHRALIDLIEGHKKKSFHYTLKDLEEISEHISLRERVASKAERETTERFISAYLSHKIGEVFPCRIVGVTEFGLFLELLNNGAQGIAPFHLLPSDRYEYDRKHHRLIGRRHKGYIFSLGDTLEARLEHTEPISGSIVLSIPGEKKGEPSSPKKSIKLKVYKGKSKLKQKPMGFN